MIVAQRDGEWFLAAFAPHLKGCNLSTPFEPRSHRQCFHLWNNELWVQSNAPLTGIRFFPKARWRGTRLFVAMWSWGQADPRPHVGCSVNLLEIDQERWFGRTGLQYAELIEPCAKLGWRVDLLDAAVYGAVPIDELELTEGPPPEGVF